MREATATELLARAIDNDQAAWNALVDRYTRLVWHIVSGFRQQLDPDKRADVHQSTWLRFAERLDTIREPEAIGGWLARTAYNECLRELRALAREVPSLDIELEPDNEPLDTHLLQDERDGALWTAFRNLDSQCQQLLRLLLAEPPFSYDEIAVILGLNRGSISRLRRQCLDALRTDPGVAAMEGQL